MTINESHDNINPSPLLSDKKGSREYKYKFYTFVLISLLQIFVNYDFGVVPVMLNWIQKPYDFSSTELGVMGCLPYIGYIVVSPALSMILLKYNNKNSLSISFILNIISLCIFGLAINKYMFLISKFCIGVFQALFITYYPIWVDTFAPESNRNLWMAIIQGGIVVGATIGYIFTSLFSFAGDRGWRYSILTQASCELILIILFYFIPKEFINFDPSRDEDINFDLCTCEKSKNDQSVINSRLISINDESITKSNKYLSQDIYESVIDKNTVKRSYTLDCIVSKITSFELNSSDKISKIHSNSEQSMVNPSEYSKCSKCFLNNVKQHQDMMNTKNLSFWSKFKLLIKHEVFILICITISGLYFDVTGIQYWITKIGISHYKIKEKIVHLIFAIECLCGPVLGIISGSYLIDQIIYHYPNNPLYVDYALITYLAISKISGLILIIFQNPMTFSICIFITVFYGAAIVPAITLMSVAYLPPYLKPAGASFFISQYNMFGFTLGTLIPGIVVDLFHSYFAGLLIIFLPGFGLGAYMLIIYIKWKRITTAKRTGRKIYIKGPVVI